MLRAEELMVGDWVYAIDANGEKHPCRANNLEYDYTNKRGDFCVDFYGTGYEAKWPDVAFNVEPIPITPEILEKNYSSTTEWYFDGTNKYCLRISRYKDKWNFYYGRGSNGVQIQINIQYVHELQHALRLCGINKTIEL